MATTVSPVAVMAMAVWDKKAKDINAQLEIEDISRLFAELREKGLEVKNVALRRVPGGLYSEDVEAFIGGLLAGGYATVSSPITIKPEGLVICEEIIARAYKKDSAGVEKVAAALNLDISAVRNQASA
jgi:hypothetical protein